MLEFLKSINAVLTPITLILVILVLIKLNKKNKTPHIKMKRLIMSTVKFLYSNYNINNTISQLVAVLKEDYSSFYLAKKYDIIKIMKIKITRKKMKNITIRINSDGEVLVSAPIRVPNSYIESLLKEKEKWIIEKVALVEERKKLETLKKGINSIILDFHILSR